MKCVILNKLVSKQGTQLIDLAKAFDTVDHKIQLTKTEIYGTGRIILKWFENYSTNRKKIYPDKQYKKHRFKGCCMRSFPGINIWSSRFFSFFFLY